MKAVLFSALVVVFGLNTAQAASADELIAKAEKAYSERGYSDAGKAKAQEAAETFAEAVKAATTPAARNLALVGQSKALYFVGNSSDAKDVKTTNHSKGYQLADQVVKAYGVNDVTKVADADVKRLKALTGPEKGVLGEALYYRGINLGQWGQANGIVDSLSKWPELRDNMQLILNVGLESIYEYGANRTLGRAYYKIPSLMGGSTKKAEKYQQQAFNGSLYNPTAPADQQFSKNGYNNTYYAETLKQNGNVAKAKQILQAFISANAAEVNPESLIETQQAQREAAELLKSW